MLRINDPVLSDARFVVEDELSHIVKFPVRGRDNLDHEIQSAVTASFFQFFVVADQRDIWLNIIADVLFRLYAELGRKYPAFPHLFLNVKLYLKTQSHQDILMDSQGSGHLTKISPSISSARIHSGSASISATMYCHFLFLFPDSCLLHRIPPFLLHCSGKVYCETWFRQSRCVFCCHAANVSKRQKLPECANARFL